MLRRCWITQADGASAHILTSRCGRFCLQTLEERMKRGCFTVVDATNIRGRDITAYKKLANEYKYRVYVVDFTDITIEEAKKRNLQREEYKQVPENVIERMYAQLADNKVPSGITVIKPEDLAQIWYKLRDLSAYKKVIHIGDIHGCYKPLKEYLEEINPQNYYIFLGDSIDRGSENA
jgi:predicted kinase